MHLHCHPSLIQMLNCILPFLSAPKPTDICHFCNFTAQFHNNACIMEADICYWLLAFNSKFISFHNEHLSFLTKQLCIFYSIPIPILPTRSVDSLVRQRSADRPSILLILLYGHIQYCREINWVGGEDDGKREKTGSLLLPSYVVIYTAILWEGT